MKYVLDGNECCSIKSNLCGIAFLLWAFVLIPVVIGGTGGNRKEDFKPRITEHPQSVIVQRGEPTTLMCRAVGQPEPMITWLKDGERLDLLLGDTHRSILTAGELFFLRVIHSKGNADVGTYQCLASNYLGEAYSNNATLEVTYIREEFRLEPSPAQAIAGEPVVLECQPPRGYPEPVVSWSKDGQDVNTDGDRVKVLQDGNLMISQSRASDAGDYVCTASNQMGSRSTDPVYLTVKAPPTFLSPLQDAVIAPGNTVIIRCEIIGDPTPTVTWTKQGSELPHDRSNIQDDNSLRIRQVSELDGGDYVCSAVNSYGSVEEEMTLTVSVIPTFTQTPVDRTVELNQMATFQCQATGSPPPTIYWKKKGSQDELVFTGLQSGRLSVTQDGELQIRHVTQDDEGYYICSADSGSGSNKAEAFLRVIASVSQPPPIIRYGPSNQTLIVGTVALLTCETAGNPAPSVRWTKDGAPLQADSNSRFTVLDTGRLQISGLSINDSGLYSCVASNDSGQTSWTASLRVIERHQASDIPVLQAPNTHELPAAPSQPVGSNITRTSLSLRWQAPGRTSPPLSPVTHYRLEYFSHEVAPEWQIEPGQCVRESCLVQQLRPGTVYLFLVRAVNDRGIGPPSPISQPITTRDDMSAIPSEQTTVIEEKLAEARVEITNAMVLSPTAVKVLWETRQHREFIEGYHLKYRAYSGSIGFTTQTVLGSTNKIITGLEANTDYVITVQPFSSRFNGPQSEPVRVTTLNQGVTLQESPIDNQVLQAKLNTCGTSIVSIDPAGSNSLKITWRVAKNEYYIDGYHIRYRATEEGDSIILTVTGSNTAVITNLTPWTQYTVTVQPFNGLYLGPRSNEERAMTGSDVPRAPPRNVQVRYNGTSAVRVSWQAPPPSTVTGVISGYYVYCLGNTTSQHRNKTTKKDELAVRVTGLVVGRVYRVEVASFTTAGRGPLSSPKSVYIMAGGGGMTDDDIDGAVIPDAGSIVTQPWFIASLAVFFLLILLCIIVFVWRRHVQYKLAGSINKGPISRDNAAAAHNMGIASSTQFIPSNHSSVQSSLQRGQGWMNPSQRPLPSTAGLMTDPSDHHGNRGCIPIGSASSSLSRAQYLQPNNAAYWLLEAYDPESGTVRQYETQQMAPDGRMHQYPPDHSCYGSGGPVYAVVDNADDDEEDDEHTSMHGPHSSRTLPMPRCPEHEKLTASNSLPQHVTEPYASTTLIMPPNVKEYDVRQPCSHSGSSEQSACSNQSRPDSRGRRAAEGVYNSSGGSSQQGARGNRKKNRHRGGSKQQPARNWTELLPPPPEQPPTDIDSPTGTTPCLAPCSHAPTTNAHMNQAPPCSYAANPHMNQGKIPQENDRNRKKAPTPPIRQFHPISPNNITTADTQHTMPGVMLPAISHRPQPTNSMPNKLGNNRSGSPADRMQQSRHDVPDRPTEATQSHPGGSCLATKRLFEDPRHEQLGKELLEFNDDMSQSEILSDNEESGPPVTCNTGLLANHTAHDYGHQPLPDRGDETDMESGSNCTDAMLGSWSSMNGSSSSGRHSSVSESSDGSFFTDADFASAVAAAAQSSGMNVVGSTVTDPRAGKKPASTSQAAPDNHGRMTTFKPIPAPPRDAATTHQSNHARKDHPLILKDTNHSGLTVTANPLAFAMENAEM
ncbi:roundabout homolog 2-like isoform X3 [Asterias amurensis]|uniref:roundabout homolog 2-like isoform X3 n=1 Tax=Asterias amurensis TaxID=7602 RepID=UPI003AB7C424